MTIATNNETNATCTYSTVDIFVSRDLVDENKWMQRAKIYAEQQREEQFFLTASILIFLRERQGANLTGCILNREPECVYQVTRFPPQTSFCTNSKKPPDRISMSSFDRWMDLHYGP